MNTPQWNTVDVPAGSYIGWGNQPGQTVIGKILSLDPTGGTDYNGGSCPELGLELIEATRSFNKEGQAFDHAAGELVNITAGGANLKRGISAAIGQGMGVGDLIKLTLEEIKPLSGGKSVKIFSCQYAKGSAAPAQAQPAAATPPQAQPAPTAAAAPTGEPVKPDNFPQEVWDTLAPEARAAVLAQQ